MKAPKKEHLTVRISARLKLEHLVIGDLGPNRTILEAIVPESKLNHSVWALKAQTEWSVRMVCLYNAEIRTSLFGFQTEISV